MLISNAIPVLKIFKPSIHKPMRLADIEKRAGLSHQTVFRKIKILEKDNILLKQGNYYRPNFENILVHKILELISAMEREEFFSKYPRLKEPFNQLISFASKNPEISYIILFGSYAIDKAGKTSDVDILTVADAVKNIKKNMDELLSQIEGGYFLNKYGFAPVYASKEDIKEMIDERKKFMQSVIEEGIIIYGEENYFNELPPTLKYWSTWK